MEIITQHVNDLCLGAVIGTLAGLLEVNDPFQEKDIPCWHEDSDRCNEIPDA